MGEKRKRRMTPRMTGTRPGKKFRGGSLRRKRQREYYRLRKELEAV